MTGVDRACSYTVASLTGLRRSELGSLTPESFHLESNVPTVVCAASYTKNGKQAEQPIPPSIVAELRAWLAGKAPGRPVFALSKKTALMLRLDLERVGIAARGRPGTARRYALAAARLRHDPGQGGRADEGAANPARHSDPKLTMNVYSHVTLHDTAGALDALPDLSRPRTASGATTGTDGVHIKNDLAHYLRTRGTFRDVS